MGMKFSLAILILLGATIVCCTYDTSGEPDPVDTETDTAESIEGLGVDCESDSDCVDYQADSCTHDPELDNAGYCTVMDCHPGECPAPFSCCDCSEVESVGVIFCASEGDLSHGLSLLCDCG